MDIKHKDKLKNVNYKRYAHRNLKKSRSGIYFYTLKKFHAPTQKL